MTLTGVTTSTVLASCASRVVKAGRTRLGPKTVDRLFSVILFSQEFAATLRKGEYSLAIASGKMPELWRHNRQQLQLHRNKLLAVLHVHNYMYMEAKSFGSELENFS